VTINKNLGKGRKVKKSKIAAKLVKVATDKIGKGKATPARGSVGEMTMGCIKHYHRPSVAGAKRVPSPRRQLLLEADTAY
jgi:hypothetical protein